MADDERIARPTPKDTGYTPGEDSFSKWRNVFSILTGQMTPEGKEQYRLARDLRNEEADCQRCEKQRDYLFKYSLFTPISQSAFPPLLIFSPDVKKKQAP